MDQKSSQKDRGLVNLLFASNDTVALYQVYSRFNRDSPGADWGPVCNHMALSLTLDPCRGPIGDFFKLG